MKLELQKVHKSFRKHKALVDFNITFTSGIYGLLGPNGAGKTTLMNILTNTSLPSSGKVLWNEKDITKCGDLYRDKIGYLPQEIGLYPHFTARKFLRYISILKALNKDQIENRILEVAEFVNLSDVLDQKCGEFSGGMKRRLGIAQALLNNPEVIVLDEPTAGLDPIERIRLRNLISKIADNRIVIISTHIVSDIDKIANQVIFMDKGRMIKNDSMENIILHMEGMIWEGVVPSEELDNIEAHHRIVNVKQDGTNLTLRIISQSKPFDEAVQVTPGIEDVYLFYVKTDHEKGCLK